MTLPDIMTSVQPDEAHRLRELATDALVLEVGSWRGFSTVTMAQVATRVHAVDWHLGDEHAGHDESLGSLMDNLDRFDVREKVIVHVGSSEDVLRLFPIGYFDFAFIDAYHTTEAVRQDAELVIPLVRSNGHIAFHDYGDPRFGVKEAVDGLLEIDRDHSGNVPTTRFIQWVDLTGSLAVVRKS